MKITSMARRVGFSPDQVVSQPTGVGHARRAAATRIGAAAGVAVLGAMLIPVSAANASLAAVGPVSPGNGYPTFFEDATGLQLRLCDDPAEGCAMPAVPNPALPVSFPSNYAGENFYFAAATADASYEAALEATFAGGVAQAEDQVIFNRIRIRIDGLVIGASYEITHPYGTMTLVAEDNRKGSGEINYTDDQGCIGPPCGDFANVLPGFIGDASRPTSMNFLTREGFDKTTAVEGSPIGDPLVPTKVTGSVYDTNFFQVVGPNAGGPGVDTLFQDTFTIEGQVAAAPDPNRPSTPDLADASDTGAKDGDNITNQSSPTFTGSAVTGSTVELLVDGVVAGTATAAAGTYSITPAAALTSATHRVQARTANPAFDPAVPTTPPTPETLTSGALNILIDTVAPAAVIGTPKPTQNTADVTPTFIFDSPEAGSTFECSLGRAPETLARVYEPCVAPYTYDDQQKGDYVFATRAVDPAGNVGAASTHAWTIGTTARVPSVLDVDFVNAGNASAEVNWFAPVDDGGSPVTGYRIQVFQGTSTAVLRTVAVPANTTSTVVTGLTNGTSYSFKVRAVNAIGAGPLSAVSDSVTPVAPITAPAAPAIGTATALNGSANVTWNRPADGGSPITGYEVQAYNGGTGALVGAFRPAGAGATSLVVTGLANGTSYDFEVRAVNAIGRSAYSDRSNTVTPVAPNVAPTLTARAPAVNGTGVAVANNITATFSEVVNGVSTTTFQLRNATTGAVIPAAVTRNGTTNQWVLNPNANLARNTLYRVTLTGGAAAIRDTQGAPLTTTTWTFRTVV